MRGHGWLGPALRRGHARYGSAMDLTRLRERLTHDGIGGVAKAAAYRGLRAATGLRVVHLFEKTAGASPACDFDVRLLSAEDVGGHAGPDLPAFLAGRIEAGLSECLGAFDGEELAAFVWVGREGFPADWVYGPPLRVGPGEGYLYNAVTRRAYRGRRLFAALTETAIRRLELSRVLLTVEAGNGPSRRAAAAMGAVDRGRCVTWGTPYGRVLRMPSGFALAERPGRILGEAELP